MVTVLIMSGYGINCESETKHAFELAGADAEIVHINDLIARKKNMAEYDIMAFPGGFSYGDDTGSGNAFASKLKNHLWDDLLHFVKEKKPIIGMCNGFQIMTRLGLFALPTKSYGGQEHALIANESCRYECRWVHLRVHKGVCKFTQDIASMHLPVAHGEGKFTCEEQTLAALSKAGQIVFTYADEKGNLAQAYPDNPNGSMGAVAGICDHSGTMLGLMPHPERGLYTISEPEYFLKQAIAKTQDKTMPTYIEANMQLFKNIVSYVKNK